MYVELDGQGPRYAQLIRALKAAILDARLAAGSRLPASRTLARELDVSRNTVLAAYEQLQAEGFLLGRVGSVEVACLQGRVHLYEGHDPATAVRAVRVLARLGSRAVVLTNAAGGLDQTFTPGDLMLITDHLNLTGRNPLVGANDDRLGPRFPDMTRAYDPELARLARAAANETGTSLQKGVYAALLGPTYETPAEIHMLRVLGANAVGMSTVPEVIALRHMGVAVGAISCITNMAAGMTGEALDHSEVETTARSARERFTKLLGRWVELVGAAQLGAR